jgi:putative acetyltransferase
VEGALNDFSTLTIRGLHSDDSENLFALWSIPDVLLNTVDLPYIAEDAFRDQVLNTHGNAHVLVAETGLSSGRKRLLGVAWLAVLKDRRRHAGTLKVVVHPEQREGSAETGLLAAVLDLADRWLGLRRLETTIYTVDERLLALYAQHGFVIEATMQRYAFRAGVYEDACLLARLHRTDDGEKN